MPAPGRAIALVTSLPTIHALGPGVGDPQNKVWIRK